MSAESTIATKPEAPMPAGTAPAALVPRPGAIPVTFDADDPVSLYMDTGIFEQLQRVARMMAKANLVPAHLRSTYKEDGSVKEDKTADCFLVAAQAFRWRMDPFSVAQHTFVTQGKLGYEGKLIAGLINASGKLRGNLKPAYSGAAGTPQRTVTIVGGLKAESEERTIEGTVSGWATQNEKWKTMPDQMLFYRGAREWARRHMPEVMLGISAEEEVLEMERGPEGGFVAAPTKPALVALTERLQAQAAAPPADTAEPEAEKPASVPPEGTPAARKAAGQIRIGE